MHQTSLNYVLSLNPEVVLVDASGVLYNEHAPHPGVPDAIREIQRQKIPVMVVTNNTYNSPQGIERRLKQMEIHIPADNIISSGFGLSLDNETHNLVRDKRVYVFGSDESHYYVQQVSNVEIVEHPSDAEVVVLAATIENQVQRFNGLVEALAETSVTVVCCNPDRYIMTESGRYPVIGYYADRLADELNLPVFFVGKPHANFSKIVAESVKNRYNLNSFSGVFFFDDNPDNVRQLTRDTGIRGVLVQETGLAAEMPTQEIESYQLEFAIPAFKTT